MQSGYITITLKPKDGDDRCPIHFDSDQPEIT